MLCLAQQHLLSLHTSPLLSQTATQWKWLLKKNIDTAAGVNFLAYFQAHHRMQDLQSDSQLHTNNFFPFLLALPPHSSQI